ncbi:transcriptional regulator, partial [Levilactobacillus brevis]|nr:transcriptional regulator [Levilactobacillus brevis]
DYDHLMRLAGYIDNNSDPDKPEYVDLKEQINDKKKIMTFEGRIIPDEDLEYMERLLRGGKKD